MLHTPNARYVLAAARASVDRTPLDGEEVTEDVDVLESPSRTIATHTFLRWIYQGELYLAERAKGQYLTGLTETYQGPYPAFAQDEMVRPLLNRVERQDDSGAWRRCLYRSASEHRRMEASSREATETVPAYTYDGGLFVVYPNTGGPATIRIAYIGYPSRLTATDIPDAPWVEPGGDTLSIDPVLLPCLSLYVTAKAQRALGRVTMHAWFMQLMEQWLRPLARDFRIGTPDAVRSMAGLDREVNVEY